MESRRSFQCRIERRKGCVGWRGEGCKDCVDEEKKEEWYFFKVQILLI